jgi:hypothetical protein
MPEDNENELYYWFDMEQNTVEELIEEEFLSRINEIKQAFKNWENVVA